MNRTPEQLRRSLVIYVAGPYRNKSNWEIHKNIFRAEELAFRVWEAGMSALSPHLNTAHFQYALPDEAWLDGDLAMLQRCDALLLTENWEKSTGTKAEVEFACRQRIPVFYRFEDLIQWADAWVSSRSPLQTNDRNDNPSTVDGPSAAECDAILGRGHYLMR